LEAELQMGVLSLQFEDGVKFIVNSHRAARQIWMAANRSAWHFDWNDGQWVTEGEELWSALSRALSDKLNRSVDLRSLQPS
ncbi:MAG: iron donor protein CyaY, partial [Myxococcota bacterium]